MYLLKLFFLFSIFGYFMEITLQAIRDNEPGHSGILYGPWCPVYGIGACLIFLTFNQIEQWHLQPILTILIMYLTSFICLSLIEWIGGNLIEKIFHIVFWDYSDQPYHFGKYISLRMSTIWSIGSLILYYALIPLTNRIFFPPIFSWVLLCLLLLDYIISFLKQKRHQSN